MFQLHVIVDDGKNWLDYTPPWLASAAALVTVIVALVIARNQNRLQETVAEKQIELQRSQLDQNERQLKKDLYDRRFTIYLRVRDFIGYVLREDGDIQLHGPGEYRQFWEAMEAAEMLFDADVNAYIVDVDKTARDFYVSAHGRAAAIQRGDVLAINRNGEIMNHLTELLQQRNAVFKPYLSLSHKG